MASKQIETLYESRKQVPLRTREDILADIAKLQKELENVEWEYSIAILIDFNNPDLEAAFEDKVVELVKTYGGRLKSIEYGLSNLRD